MGRQWCTRRAKNGKYLSKSYSTPPFYSVVFFRGVTWLRDSHGLFDYESRNITKKNIRTGVSGNIVRIDDEVEFLTEDHPQAALSQNEGEEGVTPILKILKQDKSK